MARFQIVLLLFLGVVFSSHLYAQYRVDNTNRRLTNELFAEDLRKQEARYKWEKATKIGYYDNLPTYSDASYIPGNPYKLEVGNECLVWGHLATVVDIVDEQSCIIRFDNFKGYFLLKGYPTQNFYDDMSICLISHVKCTGVTSGERNIRILQFIPKEESLKKIDEILQQREQRRLESEQRRLESSGFKKYELKNGETFYGHYKKTQGGFLVFESFDGATIQHKLNELTAESVKIYKEERKALQVRPKQNKKSKRSKLEQRL